MVSSRPWRLWHVWCSLLFGVAYLTFNVLYIVAFDGTSTTGMDYIYDVIDWNNEPGFSALFVGISLVAFLILFSVFYFIAKLRDMLWRKWHQFSPEDEMDSVPTNIGNDSNSGAYIISIKLQDRNEQ
jgi:hypothetical protein